MVDYAGSTVTGTVSAKFTWVPDAGNAAPPTDVYVLEHGYAKWYNNVPLGPAPNAVGGRRPSIETASFSSRHPARLRLVQAAAPMGSAVDGLDDTQVVTTQNGITTGISQGYKVVLCHPATDGTLTTLTTDDVILSGAPPSLFSDPSWNFSCQIFDLKITRKNQTTGLPVDVTYHPNDPEQNVMVGEKNEMVVTMSALPADAGTPTYQWDIQGDKVKGFANTPPTPGNPTAVPPIPATPHTGKKIPLPVADLQQNNLYFYWYNGTPTGDPREISVVITFDGKPSL